MVETAGLRLPAEFKSPGRAGRSPDDSLAIAAGIAIGALSPSILTMMPVVVQAFIERGGVTEAQGGLVASIEVFGILLSTSFFAMIQGKIKWSYAAMFGFAAFVAANLASAHLSGFLPLATMRFAAGIGAGQPIAVSFAALAITRHPDRWIGWMVAAVLSYAGLGLWFIPLIYKLAGLPALMYCFAAMGLVGFSAAFFATGGRMQHEGGASACAPPIRLGRRISALATVFLFFVGYAVIWTYMALLGSHGRLSDDQVSLALTVSQLFGVLGAVTVAVGAEPIERRFGRRTTLAMLIILGAGTTAAFGLSQHFLLFCALNAVFQFTWNAGQPALLGAIASADPSGRLVTAAVPMQFLGYAIGPALAAVLLNIGLPAVILVSAFLIAVSYVPLLPLTASVDPDD